jgi:hypothetical protein
MTQLFGDLKDLRSVQIAPNRLRSRERAAVPAIGR